MSYGEIPAEISEDLDIQSFEQAGWEMIGSVEFGISFIRRHEDGTKEWAVFSDNGAFGYRSRKKIMLYGDYFRMMELNSSYSGGEDGQYIDLVFGGTGMDFWVERTEGEEISTGNVRADTGMHAGPYFAGRRWCFPPSISMAELFEMMQYEEPLFTLEGNE